MNIKTWYKASLLGGLLLAGGCWVAYANSKVVVFPLDIKFDTNMATIKPGKHNDAEFKKLTSELNNYPYAKVQIQGYADSTGPEAFNQKLSEQRAQAVRQRFIDTYGIGSERIESMGFGDTKPMASNATSVGRTKNRQVVARIFRLEPTKTEPNGNHL